MLAIMDVEKENAANLTLFWQLWNEVLQEVSGKEDYHFNPKGWIVDENPANWKSMHNVFGDSGVERTYSCEFHFKQSIIRHAGKAPEPQEFKDTCQRLLTVCTKEAYMKVYRELQNLRDSCGLTSWLKWWHEWKGHIFRTFKPFDVSNTNLAESGHAYLARTTGYKVVQRRL